MTAQRTPLLSPGSVETSSLPSSPTSLSLSSLERMSQIRRRNITRYVAYGSAILSCLCANSINTYSLYGHLFQERLRYTQLQVNTVIIAGELALYLSVPIFGYLCDRVGPSSMSLVAAIMFVGGYGLAALTYRSGASPVLVLARHKGWPLWIMVVSFVLIGMATTAMYISGITTCAKNFGRGKYKGFALAVAIAAVGLSGMWQSQIGSRLLYETYSDGTKGDVDVFKFFIFLAITLGVVGLQGAFFMKVVDEDELIDDAVDELERSGLLEDSDFFRRRTYGAINETDDEETEAQRIEDAKALEEEEARKKAWLLNEETRRFLKDHTMWWLAAGIFFVTGPGEAFITNLGTIIGTLYPPTADPKLNTSAATHVSIVAATSTLARILFGTLSDFLAPLPATHHQHYQSASNSLASLPPRRRPTISRVGFLITSGVLLFLGQVLLASGLIQNHGERFWLVSTLIGSGYGAFFSLAPVITSVIWGVENFGTNWGILAMSPAFGATIWGVIYSNVYQWAAEKSSTRNGMAGDGEADDVLCYGKQCYEATFWSMAASVAIGCALWVWAWKGKGGWSARGIAV